MNQKTCNQLLLCPSCGTKDALVKYQERYDADKRSIELHICTACTALVNVTDLSTALVGAGNYDRQKSGSENFYAVDKNLLSKSEVDAAVNARLGMVEYAISLLPAEFKRRKFADIGAGSGYLAAAAARYFDCVYAIDFNTAGLRLLHPYFEHHEKIFMADQIKDISDLDMVVMWHTLEHLLDPLSFLKEVYQRTARGGCVFFQCPMLRPEYVVSTHYVFFGEPSIRIMCEKSGFNVVSVTYDSEYDFITCMAVKQ